MIGSLTKALKKVFGDKHQRDLKEVMPLVEEIKAALQRLFNAPDHACVPLPAPGRGVVQL